MSFGSKGADKRLGRRAGVTFMKVTICEEGDKVGGPCSLDDIGTVGKEGESSARKDWRRTAR